MLRVLDLFSGIGAYALGVERAGMQVVAFCECEEYPRKILRKHWPDVPIYEDVRTLDAATLFRDGIAVDVIIGGWPCQGNSPAGTGLGMDDPRSGLWSEIARILGELVAIGRPVRLLILENSSNLLGVNGGADFGRVLGDLAALGYDAEWHCLSAAGFDAPHIRDRIWIVAHRREAFADAGCHGCDARRAGDAAQGEEWRQPGRGGVHDVVPDADRAGRPLRHNAKRRAHPERRHGDAGDGPLANANSVAPIGTAIARAQRHTWDAEPGVARVAPRSPLAVDRGRALGNCNPPIIIETIAREVLAACDARVAAAK